MLEPESAFDDVELRLVTKVAALDLGSNSFHLVVARIVADSVQILHRVKQKVRLADGLDKDGVLSEEAMQRGLDTLKVMAESIRGFEPDSVRIVATHTLRKASNAKAFIKASQEILPYPIEIISGSEEARLIYLGVAHTSHVKGQSLVIDIGGGSTEFIIGEGFDTKLLRSLQMGCVNYTQSFFKNGELKNKAFDKAITAAQQEMEMIERKYRNLGWQHAIGCSGTIKTISEIVQHLDSDSADNMVTLEDLKIIIKQCCAAGHADKLQFEGLTDDRRGVFAAGLAILTAIFESLEIKELFFSPSALREGVIYEMEDRLEHSDIRQRTAESLAIRYDVDTEQAKRVLATTLDLYNACKKDWKINQKELKSMLCWAALLHEVGLQINSRGVQRHSAYILQFVDLPGFNQEQQNLLATLVRFHRKKIRLVELNEFSQYQMEQVYKLIVLLRIGVLLNIRRQDEFIPTLAVEVDKANIQLSFPPNWLEQKPLLCADLESEATYIQSLGLSLAYH